MVNKGAAGSGGGGRRWLPLPLAARLIDLLRSHGPHTIGDGLGRGAGERTGARVWLWGGGARR